MPFDEDPISLTLVRSALDLVWYRSTRRVTTPRSGRKHTAVIRRRLSEAPAMSLWWRGRSALRKQRRLRHDLLEDEGHRDARGILLRR